MFFFLFTIFITFNGIQSLNEKLIKIPLFDSSKFSNAIDDINYSLIAINLITDEGVYGKFNLGTPSQTFNLRICFDASFTWIPSVNCDDKTYKICKLNKFNASSSSSYKNLNEFVKFNYPNFGGKTSGFLGSDTFKAGKLN